MNKLEKRWLVLAISFLIFILLFIYYKETRKISDSCELDTVQSSKDISDVEVEVSVNNLGKALIMIVEQSLNEVEEKNETQESTLEGLNTKINVCFSENETVNYYGIVKSIGDVEEKYIDTVEEKLLTLPQVLVDSFIEEGWSIVVTAEDLATQYGYTRGTVMGITDYQAETIYIEDREKAVQLAVEHEFGHYLDYIEDLPSLGNEFNQIYQEEVETFKSNISNPYCVTGQQEFFAEIFACIIVDESKCTPNAKEFVESVLNELNSCN